MIQSYGPLTQTLLGTLFTWGLTAIGSGFVIVFNSGQRKILDGSLGFAAGVMTAASFWSLLAPAIDMATQSGFYGQKGQWSFVPVTVGFLAGAAFVWCADVFLPHTDGTSLDAVLSEKMGCSDIVHNSYDSSQSHMGDIMKKDRVVSHTRDGLVHRNRQQRSETDGDLYSIPNTSAKSMAAIRWRRILLLIVAITIHNIPEGLAVGVGFGAIGKSASATFENARNLAIGIGIQNFPEGLAVSLPLRAAGYSTLKSFWYGQLSGSVEPIAGLLGAAAVSLAEPILPYALAFAAGAMIYVVVDDVIPESQTSGNGHLSSWCCVVGFVTMMSLDVGLG